MIRLYAQFNMSQYVFGLDKHLDSFYIKSITIIHEPIVGSNLLLSTKSALKESNLSICVYS